MFFELDLVQDTGSILKLNDIGSLPMSFSLGGKKVPYFTSYNFKEQALRNF